MSEQEQLQLFEDQPIRTAWDDEQKNGTFPLWMWSVF